MFGLHSTHGDEEYEEMYSLFLSQKGEKSGLCTHIKLLNKVRLVWDSEQKDVFSVPVVYILLGGSF